MIFPTSLLTAARKAAEQRRINGQSEARRRLVDASDEYFFLRAAQDKAGHRFYGVDPNPQKVLPTALGSKKK